MASFNLATPLQLGDLTIRNRAFMASLTRNRNIPTSVPNDFVKLYYRQRAEGGAGLILSEGALVSQQGTEWPHAPRIDTDVHVEAWSKITKAVHESGSIMFCQLWHVGRAAHPDMPEHKASGKPVYGPSALSARGGKFRTLPEHPGYVTPTPIDDPRVIIEQFRFAAHQAKQAGFDGVELHAANGYLVHQFLDNGSNRRTDMWGGSAENRCRFAIEVIKELIGVWGPARVGIKISPGGGYNDMGMSLSDTIETYTHLITELCKLNIAYIQLSRYTTTWDIDLPPPYKQLDEIHGQTKRGTPHDSLAIFGPLVKVQTKGLENHTEDQRRDSNPSTLTANPTPTRLLLNADLTPEEAEKLLGEGKIDGAVFGTPWIANPDLYKRIVEFKPLNTDIDRFGLYNFYGDNVGEGYTDYPTST